MIKNILLGVWQINLRTTAGNDGLLYANLVGDTLCHMPPAGGGNNDCKARGMGCCHGVSIARREVLSH